MGQEGGFSLCVCVYIYKSVCLVDSGNPRHHQSLCIFQLRFEGGTRGFKSVVHGLLGVREAWPGCYAVLSQWEIQY
jgi:hypothetical protein